MSSGNAIVSDVLDAYNFEIKQQADLRDDSEDNYNYLRGNQWIRNTTAEEALKNVGKPALNLNLILPIITLILGYNVQTRYDLKAFAAGQGTSTLLANIVTKLLKHTAIESGLRFEYAQIILDALASNTGGWGYIEWTNENEPFGEFLIKRESSFSHLRDSGNEHYDINKGDYHIRTKWLSEDRLYNDYPERKDEIRHVVQSGDSNPGRWQQFSNAVSEIFTKKKIISEYDHVDQRNGLYRVVELWQMHKSRGKALYNLQTDQMLEIKGARMSQMAKEFVAARGDRMFDIVPIQQKELKIKTILSGSQPLIEDVKYDVQVGKFPFFPCYSYWIDGQGLANIENLKDYQDEHNKRTSQMLHILNGIGNSGWWVKQLGDGQSSVDIDDLIHNNTKIGFVGKYKGNQPPVKLEPNALPTGHAYLDEQAKSGIRETSGVGASVRGESENAGESGVMFNKKVQQSETMLTNFFDNVRQSKEIMGRYLVDAIPKMYSTDRTFSIALDDNNRELLEINSDEFNRIADGDFKISLDETDRSPTGQMQTFIEMLAFAGQMPPELVDWVSIIEASPFPNKQQMAQYAGDVMGMQIQQQQMEAQQATQKQIQGGGE